MKKKIVPAAKAKQKRQLVMGLQSRKLPKNITLTREGKLSVKVRPKDDDGVAFDVVRSVNLSKFGDPDEAVRRAVQLRDEILRHPRPHIENIKLKRARAGAAA